MGLQIWCKKKGEPSLGEVANQRLCSWDLHDSAFRRRGTSILVTNKVRRKAEDYNVWGMMMAFQMTHSIHRKKKWATVVLTHHSLQKYWMTSALCAANYRGLHEWIASRWRWCCGWMEGWSCGNGIPCSPKRAVSSYCHYSQSQRLQKVSTLSTRASPMFLGSSVLEKRMRKIMIVYKVKWF